LVITTKMGNEISLVFPCMVSLPDTVWVAKSSFTAGSILVDSKVTFGCWATSKKSPVFSLAVSVSLSAQIEAASISTERLFGASPFSFIAMAPVKVEKLPLCLPSGWLPKKKICVLSPLRTTLPSLIGIGLGRASLVGVSASPVWGGPFALFLLLLTAL